MFMTPHMAHVAQGQNVFSPKAATRVLDRLNFRLDAENSVAQMKEERHNHELIDHALSLRQLSSIDDEWSM
jgi:hypothetical protein